jgi:hypothetical protein
MVKLTTFRIYQHRYRLMAILVVVPPNFSVNRNGAGYEKKMVPDTFSFPEEIFRGTKEGVDIEVVISLFTKAPEKEDPPGFGTI